MFEVDPNTVLQWLVEAAEQLRAFSASFLCHLHLEQLQLDELYAVLRAFKVGEINDDEAIERVVYPTTADNYFAPKPGKMPPTQPVLKGARP